jgi:hypothetical protein
MSKILPLWLALILACSANAQPLPVNIICTNKPMTNTLAWNASPSPITGYMLEVSTNGSNWMQAQFTTNTNATVLDYNTNKAAAHYWRVLAVQYSPPSNIATNLIP